MPRPRDPSRYWRARRCRGRSRSRSRNGSWRDELRKLDLHLWPRAAAACSDGEHTGHRHVRGYRRRSEPARCHGLRRSRADLQMDAVREAGFRGNDDLHGVDAGDDVLMHEDDRAREAVQRDMHV